MASAYLVPGVEIQTRGRFFVSGGAEWLQPFGPVQACLLLPSVTSTPDGAAIARGGDRIDFEEGAGHLTVGIGASVLIASARLESKVRVGAARGQSDFRSAWLPTVTAAFAVSLVDDHLVVSLDRRWFRIPYWMKRCPTEQECRVLQPYPRPTGAVTERSWKPVGAVTVGLRF
jgi:hypothetical protein